MPEVWRSIPGYEDSYEASTEGRIRSIDRMRRGPNGNPEIHRGKILRPYANSRCRYLYVTLSGRKKRMVHTLVAEAFLGPRPEGADVMHKNGQRGDNRLENLQYGSRAENLHDTYNYGGRMKKLSLDDVTEIRHRLLSGDRPTELAKEFGVHSAAIYHIRNGTAFAWFPEVT